MGIRGLHTSIIRTIPSAIQNVDWNSFQNCRLGIDIQCFLYKSIANQLNPLKIIAEQIVMFRKLGIRAIYVFDGKPPDEKDTVVEKRRQERLDAIEKCENLRKLLNITTDLEIREKLISQIREYELKFPNLTYLVKDEIKRFLYSAGVTFVTPVCEADTLLAYCYRRGIIDAVVSFDLDFIARGVPLLVPKRIENTPGSCWTFYDPELIRNSFCFTEEEFITFCVLLGSDYTPDLPIVPWKQTLQSIRRKESILTIWKKHTFSGWRKNTNEDKLKRDLESLKRAKEILLGKNDTPETLMIDIQWSKLYNGKIPVENSNIETFRKLYSDWDTEWWRFLCRIE